MAKEYDLQKEKGLSEAKAAELLKEFGPNELPSSKPRGILPLLLEVIREPMFLLLIASGTIYLVLGEPTDAVLLFSFVFIIIGITFYQERKTERALEALRDLSSPRALVIRGGKQRRITGKEVVPGDMLVILEGDRIPADAVMLSCTNLSVNESLLTGESIPVRKAQWNDKTWPNRPGNGKTGTGDQKSNALRPGDLGSGPGAGGLGFEISRPGGDGLPFVYSGTLVVSGRGVARVLLTGEKTEMGRIGIELRRIEPERTTLQKETRNIVKYFALIGLALCLVVVLSYGLMRSEWLGGLLAGITMAMAILPEEFPVVLTVFLALGAWRMSKKNVLVSKAPAIETLGSATVLCVDKTGTLTMNQMAVAKLFFNGKFLSIPPGTKALPQDFHELVEFSILASQRDPFDPMEKALKEVGNTSPFQSEHLHHDWELVREYELSEKLLAMSHVWKSQDGKDYIIAVKGAPEAVSDLCHFSPAQNKELSKDIEKMASGGLRVIGVAKAYFKPKKLPKIQHDFSFEFLGLVGFEDPVRASVPESVKTCYEAGIKIIMITGDYPGTARNIAGKIGLDSKGALITGPELDRMGDEELRKRIRNAAIFARVVPEQKLRIVNALKANGEIVAMTGDGVNDAPALKSANMGIAMGSRGTDVAREASDLVLLDDNFSSIVGAVAAGRRLLDNIRKAMAYIIAVHVPIAGLSLLPALFNLPAILLPAHVVFLELIIDPACSIVFEAEPAEPDIMKRKPRDPKKPLFDRRIVAISFLQGLGALIMALAVYFLALRQGGGESEARALAFTTVVIANLSLILTNLSWSRSAFENLDRRNTALWWVLGGALALLGLVLYIPFLQGLFHFSTLRPEDLALCAIAGIASISWFEMMKILHRRRKREEGVVSP